MKMVLTVLTVMMGLQVQAVSDLQVVTTPADPYILPVAMQSCFNASHNNAAYDVPANSFEIRHINMDWNGTGDLKISHVEVRLPETSANSAYRCVIAAQELAAVFGDDPSAYSGGSVSNQCPIRCGGVPVKPDVGSSLIPGIIRIYGVVDDNGNIQSRIFDAPISLNYEVF